MNWDLLNMILITDMLYPVICVPGRVNGGGFHVILRLEESIKSWDISPTDGNRPVKICYISIGRWVLIIIYLVPRVYQWNYLVHLQN